MGLARWLISIALHAAFVAALLAGGLFRSEDPIEEAPSYVVPLDIVTSVESQTNIRAARPPEPPPAETAPEETPPTEEPEGAPQTIEAEPSPPEPVPDPRAKQKADLEAQRKKDAERLAGLIDRMKKEGAEKKAPNVPDDAPVEAKARSKVRDGSDITASEYDAIRAYVTDQRCWRGLDDKPNPERLTVVYRVFMAKDGSYYQPPELVSPRGAVSGMQQAAIEEARRAIIGCEPLPAARDRRTGTTFTITFGAAR